MSGPVNLQHSEDVIAQRVKEETILFDVISGEYYSLNELGSRVWDLVDGRRSMEQVIEILRSEYDAPALSIEQDVLALVDELAGDRLLLPVKA